jgi:pimeloyl-ACP methyl ester carboxylesterase
VLSAATAFGAILISLNTRTASGFYANTACGGPQEQDVLDAIALETSTRHVASVYLIGFSMGSVGALTIATRHPGLVRGIALAGRITDLFEAYAYGASVHAAPVGLIVDLCGSMPSPTGLAAARFFAAESPLRFSPANFSSIRIYATSGGLDRAAPNNYSIWPYAQGNSSLVNASCRVVATLGEPAGCTTPLGALARAHPGQYLFRYVYEAAAPHTSLQINATDMFRFFTGQVPVGLYTANFPPTVITAASPRS